MQAGRAATDTQVNYLCTVWMMMLLCRHQINNKIMVTVLILVQGSMTEQSLFTFSDPLGMIVVAVAIMWSEYSRQ
jgi:hypothetical protein